MFPQSNSCFVPSANVDKFMRMPFRRDKWHRPTECEKNNRNEWIIIILKRHPPCVCHPRFIILIIITRINSCLAAYRVININNITCVVRAAPTTAAVTLYIKSRDVTSFSFRTFICSFFFIINVTRRRCPSGRCFLLCVEFFYFVSSFFPARVGVIKTNDYAPSSICYYFSDFPLPRPSSVLYTPGHTASYRNRGHKGILTTWCRSLGEKNVI